MATSLAKQLQQLALPESKLVDNDLTHPSLLFEKKVANSLDKDTFYALGLNGFQELCGFEPMLHELYFKALFSEVAADTERSIKSKEFNENLNAQIESFLLHLSPYVLLRPAQKCLEWLIYRFRIHLFNADSLMKCALPYYRTNTFVRIVQLLDTTQTSKKWAWVSNAQVDGVSITQVDIISYCSSNVWFLEFICESLVKLVKINSSIPGQWQSRSWINLFTSTVLGVINHSNKIKENLLVQLMPVISKGIKSKHVDFQASCFMIISLLLVKDNFKKDALNMIVDSTTKYCLPQLQKQALHMTALLCYTQENFETFSKRSFRRLSSWDCLLEVIVSLSASSEKIDRFLSLFFNSLIPKAYSATDIDSANSGDSEDEVSMRKQSFPLLLKSVVDTVQLSKKLQKDLLKLLIINYSNHGEQTGDLLKEVIHRMQKKYSDAFDDVISNCMNSGSVPEKIMQSFLSVSLTSIKHELLIGPDITLTFALSHPEATIRQLSVQRLAEELLKSNCTDETKLYAVKAVRTILSSDSSPIVVAEAVQVIDQFPELFIDGKGELCEKLLKIVEQKWNDLNWNDTVIKSVQCLVAIFLISHGTVVTQKQKSLKNRILLVILNLLVQSFHAPDDWSKRQLIEAITSSQFLNESSILISLLQPAKNFEDFLENLRVASLDGTCVHLINLLDTAMDCIEISFYSPVLLLLILICLRSNEDKLVLKAIGYLSKATRTLWMCNQNLDVYETSCNYLIEEIFNERDSDSNPDLVYLFLLHIWKDTVSTIPKSLRADDYIDILDHNHDVKQSSTLLLFDVFEMLLDFLSLPASKSIMEFVQKIFATFLNKAFDDAADALLFVSTFFLRTLLSNWNEDSCSSANHSMQSCYLISIIISTGQLPIEKMQSLFRKSLVLPSLLLACTSSNKLIRSAAVKVMRDLSQLPDCSLSPFLHYLTGHFEEILLDPHHCSLALSTYFVGSNPTNKEEKKKTKLLLSFLTNHVVNPLLDGKLFGLAAKLYEKCFFKVENVAVFESLIPLLESLLHREVESTALVDRCVMTKLLLQKITSATCSDFRKERAYVDALQTKPESYKSLPDINLAPQFVALELLQGNFFKSLSSETQKKVFNLLISISITTSADVAKTLVSKAIKAISIPSKLVMVQLEEWNMFSRSNKKNVTDVKRAKMQKLSSPTKVTPTWWKKFVALLEFLHHKKRISHSETLIGPFFDILMDVIEEKYSAVNMDYVTLLLLGCLLNLFERSKSLRKMEGEATKINIKVDLLVRCIHSTRDTQAHQHALMLLAKAARFCPEKVLHSVMSVFTFMGSTLLRRDDAYSFQVITQTIQTIIPPLVELETKNKGSSVSNANAVLGILRVFVDSLPHIPAHRRLVIFEELLDKVGPDTYLWRLMVMMVDQHVCDLSKTTDGEEENVYESAASRMEASLLFWSSITQLFPVRSRVNCVIDILTFLQNHIIHQRKKKKASKSSTQLIDTSQRSTNQIRRFHVTMLTLASYVIKGAKSSSKEREDVADVGRLLECTLVHMGHVNEQNDDDTASMETSARYQKALQRRVADIIEKINSLLPLDEFLSQLHDLLDVTFVTQHEVVLQKLISIFHNRIVQQRLHFSQDEEKMLMKLSVRFLTMLREGCEHGSMSEPLLHTASLGLTHIIRVTCTKKPTEFVATQPIICDVIAHRQLSDNLLSSLLICLGEVIINLKAYSIANLAKLSNCFISLLASDQLHRSESVFVSLLSTINKLFSCLGHFLSPYIDGFLTQLSILSCNKQQSGTSPVSSQIISKPAVKRSKRASNQEPPGQLACNVLQLVVNKVASRVWVPALERVYDKISEVQPVAVSSLLSMAGQQIPKFSKEELSQHSGKLMDFFLHSMLFRSIHKEMDFVQIDVVEKTSLDGVIAFLVKLPETLFRPLYGKLYDWGRDADLPRSVTSYHCTSLMAAKLKGLFEIVAADLLADLSKELSSSQLSSYTHGRDEDNVILKLTYVLSTLGHMLNYSSANLLSQDKFETIFKALLKQLEIEFSDRSKSEEYFNKHLLPCVGYLAGSVKDNISWQPFNHSVLMKTRHSLPIVRCRAVECLKVVVEKLGAEYVTQIPEMIPYLAELLEDESDEVENCCQRAIKQMEEALGEPLQKYF